MSFLVSILVAIAIGFAGTATTAPEQPITPTQSVQIEQVDPILAMDAETTLSDYRVNDFNDEKGNHYTAQYIGSDESSDSLFGEFTYESIDFPGTYHHYTYSILTFA